MNCDKTVFSYTDEDLFLNFIDEKRNEETEKRFSSYIEYYNFNENDEMTEEENDTDEQ